jgi:hypothetical protein
MKTVSYLGCNVLFERKKLMVTITGILKNTLIPHLIQKTSKLKLCKLLAHVTLLYVNEMWTVRLDRITWWVLVIESLWQTALLNNRRSDRHVEELKENAVEENRYTCWSICLQLIHQMQDHKLVTDFKILPNRKPVMWTPFTGVLKECWDHNTPNKWSNIVIGW